MSTASVNILVQILFFFSFLHICIPVLTGEFCICSSQDPGNFAGPRPVFVSWCRFIHHAVVKIYLSLKVLDRFLASLAYHGSIF